ncbi:chaperone protein dnaJ 11, chloroplastic [Amaranthus tricolor]|uniref:chaperone protein dnaJ 11, chloroplastic n=1 Tax=Amaranthus tricolor TaxID=29722 RepID=UPI002584689E|nr:chaperone protein dnaJ 11, chloroplastic [Amaranthus tricolor]
MLSFSLYSPSLPSFKPKPPKPLTGKVYLSSSPIFSTFRRPYAVSATASPETSVSSLYEVLGISIEATNEEIKIAYRKLARSCHPDITGDADEFMRVNAAYSILSDPDKRADYDRKLYPIVRRKERRFPGLSASPTSSFCQFPRRNWETDQCW